MLVHDKIKLQNNGLVVLKKIYPKDFVNQLNKEYEKRWRVVKKKLPKKSDKKGIKYFENAEIMKLEKGRYDFNWKMNEGVFSSNKFLKPKRLYSLIKEVLESDFFAEAGALPTFPGAKNGGWHRDVYTLFNDENLQLDLPPFYITVLIPLQDLDNYIGGTEFIENSHRLFQSNFEGKMGYIPECRAGDAIVFNGMMYHRGLANYSKNERKMLYIVFCKKWYRDYTV